MSQSEIVKAVKYLKWWKDPASFFKDVFKQDPYPYQAKVLRDFREIIEKQRKNIRLAFMAAGGTGKTKLLASLALVLTTVATKFVNEPYSVIIISGSREQARFLYEYVRVAFLDNPILAEEVEGEPLMSITRLKNRSVIKAVPNSLKAIQGEHTDVVIIDEAPLAGDFIIRDAFRIVAQSSKDIVILSGTPLNESMGAQGDLFIDIWENEDLYPGWKRYHWSARDCPSISLDKYLEAKKVLTDDMFDVFWEGKPAAVGNTLIPLKKLKEASRGNPIFKLDPNGGPVVMGVDWGWRDPTAIVIVQYSKRLDEIRVLYIDQFRFEQFTNIQEKIAELYKQYNVCLLYTSPSPRDISGSRMPSSA